MGTGRSGLPKGIKNTTAQVLSQENEHGALGLRVKPLYQRYSKIEDALGIVNPYYNHPGTGTSYTTNCALCTTAAALQFMGYDVEAMPRDTTWRGFSDVFDFQWTPENFKAPKNEMLNYAGVPWGKSYYNTNRFTGGRVNTVAAEIESQMKSWGTNSFAAMSVCWRSGGSHSIFVYQSNSGTRIMDFQTHRSWPVSNWFATHRTAVLNSIGLYRLDNQKIKSEIKDLDKIVRRRKK